MNEKRRKISSTFISLVVGMAVPLLLLTIFLLIMGRRSVTTGLEYEIEQALGGTARTTLDILDMEYPGDLISDCGVYFKGDVCLKNNYELIDMMKENTGYEISIFYSTQRILTTIRDANGERIIRTVLQDPDIWYSIRNGREYYSKSIKIGNVSYYGYYVPIKNQGDEVVGMLFAGMPKDTVNGAVSSIIKVIVWVVISSFVVIILILLFFARSFSKGMEEIKAYIGSLANSDFAYEMPKQLLQKKSDIGDLARYSSKVGVTLKGLIYTDPLTGLHNRRAGQYELSKLIKIAQTENLYNHFTVAMADIDFFKKVNDTYGHDLGDEVLKEVADIFADQVKYIGTPIRWGGEEFLIIFNKDYRSSMSQIVAVVNRIRKLDFDGGTNHFGITMTFGVADYVEGDTVESIVKRADERLYIGKTTGRNKIVGNED